MNSPSDHKTFPKDRPLHTRRRLVLFAVGPASYALLILLSLFPSFAEAVYRNAFGPFVMMVLSSITGLIPIAVGELLVIAVLLYGALKAIVALKDSIGGKRRLRNIAASGALRIAQGTGILIGLFYLLWGYNYAVNPLPQRLDWPVLEDVTAAELTDLVVETVVATNAAYIQMHGTVDTGEPTKLPDNRRIIEDALRSGWMDARQELDMPPFGNRFGRVKTPLLTRLYEWVGIAGYYFPFTAEGNVRSGIPAIDYPKILAHEMMHQRGVARESEANFWAYLAAVHSDNQLVKYSAYRFANRQMVSQLATLDWETALLMSRRRLPGVQRDIDDSRRYWQRLRGRGTEIGSSVNNAFLRSNRVEGGIRSYSMSAYLFVSYARQRGGHLVPETDGSENASR